LIESIDVPADGHCLFWAIALAYLMPLKDDDIAFEDRFKRLFGEEELEKLESVKTLIQRNNSIEAIRNHPVFKNLVTTKFRHRVVGYMSNPVNSGQFEAFPETVNEHYTVQMRANTRGGDPEIDVAC
jgi:hypothetical protein